MKRVLMIWMNEFWICIRRATYFTLLMSLIVLFFELIATGQFIALLIYILLLSVIYSTFMTIVKAYE